MGRREPGVVRNILEGGWLLIDIDQVEAIECTAPVTGLEDSSV